LSYKYFHKCSCKENVKENDNAQNQRWKGISHRSYNVIMYDNPATDLSTK
jgi:hypothetical protein